MTHSLSLETPEGRRPLPAPSHFLVGQDRDGRWIAVETRGLGGGLFRSRGDAVRYALSQTSHRPDAVTLATERVEFRI